MLVIGDIHAKNKEPYRTAIRTFFEMLIRLFNEDDGEFLFLGDLFDSSSPHNDVEDEIIGYLKQMKRVGILSGNHDQSRRMGNTLSHLKHHDNITIITEPTEATVRGKNCLFLPFKHNMDEYQDLTGDYKYIFTHVAPIDRAFGNEGINFHPDLKGIFIHGHTHMTESYTDKQGRRHHILGVPVATRHGEMQEHRIVELSEPLNFIPIDPFIKYKTIRYGEAVNAQETHNTIYNIIDAPSVKAVYDMYNSLVFIRKEGIEIQRKTKDTEYNFKKDVSIQSQFNAFVESYNKNVEENGGQKIDDELKNETLKYLDFI